eukprot:TRINITY_DN12793_c0_g1_i1.p1 TRINITY_DN12793_c0_g1~~TRINITY_DN12793_c0_g1_i1.p1  ORF type:complete len:228 (-),score=39.35 TRINITY_DN12793_c0_g1_i1:207-890(-)
MENTILPKNETSIEIIESTQNNNIENFKISDIINDIPKTSGFLCILVATMFSLKFLINEQYLQLIPARSLPPFNNLWNIITGPFFEKYLINIFIDFFAIIKAGKYLRLVWGESEFFKYTFIVSLTSSISTLILVFIYANLFSNYEDFLRYHFCGFSPIILGYLISFAQLRGEKEISLYSITIQSKILPFYYYSFSSFLFAIGYNTSFLLTLNSFFFSWLYLRYFQTK